MLEEQQAGATTARYVWSPVYVDALVLRDRATTTPGTLDERLWVQQDANWNVTAVVDGSGAVVERYAYDPFGAVTVYSGDYSTVRSVSVYSQTYLWQGRPIDSISGNYYFRNRDVSPTLGRPTQVDILGFSEDVNFYRWEANNPVRYNDPSGMGIRLIRTSDGADITPAPVGQFVYVYPSTPTPPPDRRPYFTPFTGVLTGVLAPDLIFDQSTWFDRPFYLFSDPPPRAIPQPGGWQFRPFRPPFDPRIDDPPSVRSTSLPGEVLLPGPGTFRAGGAAAGRLRNIFGRPDCPTVSRLFGHNEYTVTDAALAARVRQGLEAYYTRNAPPGATIRWVDNVPGGRNGFLDTVTGDIRLSRDLLTRYPHLAEGVLMEELQHFHQLNSRAWIGRSLTSAEQDFIERGVIQRIQNSGFQIYDPRRR